MARKMRIKCVDGVLELDRERAACLPALAEATSIEDFATPLITLPCSCAAVSAALLTEDLSELDDDVVFDVILVRAPFG